MNVSEVIKDLGREYGVPQWQPHTDPLTELIRAILSQNTSDANSGRAFRNLAASFGSWEDIAAADVDDIAGAIRDGGLNKVKAGRIKKMLQDILNSRGSLDLSFLAELPIGEAKAWLRDLPGVGQKTAACVLLFGLGRPALPVDTHVHRVSRRLGLIDARVSAERASEILEAMVPPEDVYQFHINLIAHGRRVCRAQHPRCNACVLAYGCPSSLLRNAAVIGAPAARDRGVPVERSLSQPSIGGSSA
ncbi:MAG: endonuclease III domain-containing protein [Chloroflexota bacterium]